MDMTLGIVGIVVMVITFGLVHFWYKKKTSKLVEELTLFKKEKEYVSEAMLVFSEKYDIVFANQAAKALFSLNNNLLETSKNVKLKINTAEAADFFEVMKQEFTQREDSFHLQNALLIILGKSKQVNIYADKSAWNLNKTISCVIDMNPIRVPEVKTIQKDSGIDILTDLPNQFTALTNINTLVMKNQRSSTSFALLLFGIDHFSELQTTLGLTFTNQIIKDIAEYLKTYDAAINVYRMDCDKFLLIVEKIEEDENINDVASKLIIDMKNSENTYSNLSTSIGITIYPDDGENATKLINRVYVALEYAQKNSDSNVVQFGAECQVMNKDESKMNEEIELALKRHEFFLYYQPMFNIKTEGMIGAEALIRWNHPELGVIPADNFLEVAKKTGLIVEIGEYVFREAIKQRKIWNEKGLQIFKMSINLSLKEMQVEKLIQKIEAMFEDYSIDPKDFNLEITEKSAMVNIDKTMIDFRHFRHLGLSLSLDNFGADRSSIKSLQALPLAMIKIDKSLISDLYTNVDHQITVKAMIEMIHSLGFKVVAEGVESSKELALLHEYGCDYAQGYLFAKPLPAKELEALLQ